MLSAEAVAIETETRRGLLEIRSQEVAQMCQYFHALGTQTALISGFVIALFTATIDVSVCIPRCCTCTPAPLAHSPPRKVSVGPDRLHPMPTEHPRR